MSDDPVNHPKHYTSHASGVECIQVTEHMNFNRGNAVKYIWRAGDKGDAVQDLQKARWYIEREIERLQKTNLQTLARQKISAQKGLREGNYDTERYKNQAMVASREDGR